MREIQIEPKDFYFEPSKPSFQNWIYEEFPLFSPLNFSQYQSQRKGKFPFKQFLEMKKNPKNSPKTPLSKNLFPKLSVFFKTLSKK